MIAAQALGEVHQPQLNTFTNPWFHLDDTRTGVVFTASAGGVTTKNSTYPRSELREMTGTEKASWSNTTGTHVLRLRQAVTRLPSSPTWSPRRSTTPRKM